MTVYTVNGSQGCSHYNNLGSGSNRSTKDESSSKYSYYIGSGRNMWMFQV